MRITAPDKVAPKPTETIDNTIKLPVTGSSEMCDYLAVRSGKLYRSSSKPEEPHPLCLRTRLGS